MIHTWNKEDFGNNFQEKKILLVDIESTRKKGIEGGWDEELRQQEKDLLNEIEASERQEDIFWKQKSRNQWM